MSFEVVKITDFAETLIFALRATLKKWLEENASHQVLLLHLSVAGSDIRSNLKFFMKILQT